MKIGRGWTLAALSAAFLLPAIPQPVAAQEVDFNRDVLPLLSTRCFVCHGPDATARKAELRLDNAADAFADRDGSAAIKPGQPGKSLMIDRISRGDKAGRMPPPKTGPGLTAEQIQLLTKWIEQGAHYTEHWAFVAPKQPALPNVSEHTFVRNPIDAFVLANLEHKKLPHADMASRHVLIRRATLDLLGLPPTPAEVDAFVNDKSPDAYEKLVERLLQSPHYGERWGRHWLDVVRYADSGGFETDIFFSHAWRYRDYVIRSFNVDKPFDRFIREQIAGDELFKSDAEAQLATAMYTIAPVLQESAMVAGSLEYDLLTDGVDTTGSAFLGLTVGCARCHDHKYDPFSQRDYFGMQALFAASDQFDIKPDGSKINNNGKLAVKTTLTNFEVEQAKARLRQETDPAKRKKYMQQMADFYVPLPKGKGANKSDPGRLEAAEKFLDAESAIPVRVLAHRAKPLEVKLLKRGELNFPADVIPPALPAKLSGDSAAGKIAAEQRRAVLANWIASPKNPLTARVMVNRVWQGHFGQGLVRTPNDFGIRGERPTHPELLDWLTVEFVEHGASNTCIDSSCCQAPTRCRPPWRRRPWQRIQKTSCSRTSSRAGLRPR
jgi:mono/diheme cytochrome c family protein